MLKLSTTTVCKAPLKDLIPDPDQPRQTFDQKALEALADNIKERGIQVPLLVRIRVVPKKSGKGHENEIVIKDGERRWRAAKLAKLKVVPVLLAETGDTAQIRLDQFSVNNLRERLRPMELATTLHKMQTVDKLTQNEIAARLAKQGHTMNHAQVANLVKLVDLPTWAQVMVNQEQIEVSVAREIASISDKPVLTELKKQLDDALDWRGRVTQNEVVTSVRNAFRAVGKDLKKTESYYADSAVLFDYKKVCKGCPHLRESHGGAWCMDLKGFEKHQAEAKAAGLGPGGTKPKASAKDGGERKLTPKQEEKARAEKEAKRARSLEEKSSDYLHAWTRARVLAHIETMTPELRIDVHDHLVLFAAAGSPGARIEVGSGYQGRRALLDVARKVGVRSLSNILHNEDRAGLYANLTVEIIRQLPLSETLQLAHALLGSDLGALWKVDAEYLDLLQKGELLQVAEKHAQLPEGSKSWGGLKQDQLRAAILAGADQVGVPPMLARLYAEPEMTEPEDVDEDLDEDQEDFSDDGDDE